MNREWTLRPGLIKANISDLNELNRINKAYNQFIKNEKKDDRLYLNSFDKIINRGGNQLLENISKGFEFFEENLEKYSIEGINGIPENYELHAEAFERRHNHYVEDWSDFFKIKKSIGTVIKGKNKTIDLDFRYHPVGISGQLENIGFTIREKDQEKPFYDNISVESRSKLDLEKYKTFPQTNEEINNSKKSIRGLISKTESENALEAFMDFVLNNKSFDKEELSNEIKRNNGNPEDIGGYSLDERINNYLKEGSLRDNGENAGLRYTIIK